MTKSSSFVAAIALALGLFAPTLRSETGPTPNLPGPEHKKLEVWVGKWALKETISATPFGEAETREYRWEARLAHGGFIVEGHGKQIGVRRPLTWTEIHYFDAAAKAYRGFYADSEGVASHGTDTVEGTTWASAPWEVKAPGKVYQAKSTVTFAPDGKSYTYAWTYSEDGVTWKPWLTGTAKKTGKAR